MCGRFTLKTPAPVLVERFRLSGVPDLTPRYNVAPTQDVAVIRQSAGPARQREFAWMRWGLVPSWARDLSMGSRLINARSETVAEKPAFRAAFARRRCLVLADGYYEWKKGERGIKQPYWIHRTDGQPFGMAGLWETWRGAAGAELDEPLPSCTIITTDANEVAATIHDRMPVVLEEPQFDVWLSTEGVPRQQLQDLLQPYAEHELQADAVDPYVNNARHEGPRCIDGV